MSALGNVFRYFRFKSRVLESFKSKSMYFNHVDQFNDPFEGVIELRQPDFQKSSEEQITTLAKYFSGGVIKQVPFNEHNFRVAFDRSRATIKDGLETHLRNRLGVVCFVSSHIHSEERRSTDREAPELNRLMWAHYADSLKGFCVEFEPAILLDSFRTLNSGLTHDHFDIQCINYTERRLLVDAMTWVEKYVVQGVDREESLNAIKQIAEVYFTKSAAWAYEKEVRIIGVDQTKQKVAFDPSAIKRVFIGEKMHKSKRTQIVNLFRSLGVDSFCKVGLAEDSFQLVATPLE